MENKFNFGWLEDKYDERDYTVKHEQVKEFYKAIKVTKLPSRVDLISKDTPIMDQGDLGSCTANGQCGTLQYNEKNFSKKPYVIASRLFLYYVTRRYIMGVNGDTGASIRDTIKALGKYGTPPEVEYPYDVKKFDEKPPEKAFTDALPFKAVTYTRLTSLNQIKQFINNGYPVNFGTNLYDNILNDQGYCNNNPDIPYPKPSNQAIGGHAMVIVGYDDNYNINDGKGAFMIRNSWGESWGNKGYGWIDYRYFSTGLASDFWVLLKNAYMAAVVAENKSFLDKLKDLFLSLIGRR